MVKSAYIKSALRTIRRSLGRFLAIFTIVALGTGFLAGLLASSPDMRYSVQLYYADTDFFDIRVVSNLGLIDEDAAALAALDCVEAVMPAQSRDLLALTSSGDTLAVRVHSADFENYEDALNKSVLLEGKWPSAPDECVVEGELGLLGALAIGQSLTFTADNKDLGDFLAVTEYKITGVVSTSYYLNKSQRGGAAVGSGRLGGIAYIPSGSFSADYYTEIFVKLKGGADTGIFSPGYDALSANGVAVIEGLAVTQKHVRSDLLRLDAQAELDDAKREFDEQSSKARRELDDALAELEDGEAKLADALEQIDDGWKEYEQGVADLAKGRADLARETAENRAKIDDGFAQIADGQLALDEGRLALEQGELELEEAYSSWHENSSALDAQILELESTQEEIAQMRANLEYALTLPGADDRSIAAQLEQVGAMTAQVEEGLAAAYAGRAALDAALPEIEAGMLALQVSRAEIEQNQALLDEQRLELEQAEIALESGVRAANRELSRAETRLANAKYDLETAEIEVAENRVTLDDGWAEYWEGEREFERELADAEDEIQEAQDKINDIEAPKWYILDRKTNAGYVTYDEDSGKISAIARVFPMFFFMVAALVASTTMTRMVDEERSHIGTLKALGYPGGSIAMKYFGYAGLAAALGAAFGVSAGLWLFPNTIYNAYGMMYSLPEKVAAEHLAYGALASLAIFAAIMAATAGAVRSSLRECAASLMRPKAPKEGKRIFLERITPVWKRMKFTHKVTARNLLRYKKRFFMTVTGIFGCTALILCGFGLRDSLSGLVRIQYGEIFTYSFTAGLKHTGDEQSDRRIRALLADEENIFGYTVVSQQTANVSFGGRSTELTLTVPKDRHALKDFVTFRKRSNKSPVEFGENAVLISEKAALMLGLHAGDTITLENADGQTADFTLTGIVENYIAGHIYMPSALYEEAFGLSPEYLVLLAHSRHETEQVRDDISERLLVSPNVTSVSFVTGISEGFDEMLETIDYIIVIITISAGLLAFVVMYNLTNINIAEREKELATVKVLGFTSLETAMYIIRETMVLTLVGAFTGLGGGVLLHKYIIQTVEVDNMMFGRLIKPESYVISFLVTVAFSIFVNLAMSVKMGKISMAESLKAPE